MDLLEAASIASANPSMTARQVLGAVADPNTPPPAEPATTTEEETPCTSAA